MDKIALLKELRARTGGGLRESMDALKACHWDVDKAYSFMLDRKRYDGLFRFIEERRDEQGEYVPRFFPRKEPDIVHDGKCNLLGCNHTGIRYITSGYGEYCSAECLEEIIDNIMGIRIKVAGLKED